MSDGEEEGMSLEYTPTWVVAGVCTVIVAISFLVLYLLRVLGKFLLKNDKKSLFQALQKVKGELLLVGCSSLLMMAFQNVISRICVNEDLMKSMLPCDLHNASISFLPEQPTSPQGYCAQKNQAPLLSLEAVTHLDMFIFVLAIVHVVYCVLTILLVRARIHKWKQWEDSIQRDYSNTDQERTNTRITHIHQHAFIRNHFRGLGRKSDILRWLHSFFNQFYGGLTKADYVTLRLGFIMLHVRRNPKFDFHKYISRALEDDFRQVVGISWYLWVFVVFFFLMNINGWHMYFWLAFVPFLLLLAVGTKLEHVIGEMAQDVAEKFVAIEGDLAVKPSDEFFWFKRPYIVLLLIHFILFQNAFEFAFLFWVWIQYGFDSCIMGNIQYIVPRIIIGVFIQVVSSYSTLPRYAIVTQMGSSPKKAIFEDNVQANIIGWARAAKRKAQASRPEQGTSSTSGCPITVNADAATHEICLHQDSSDSPN